MAATGLRRQLAVLAGLWLGLAMPALAQVDLAVDAASPFTCLVKGTSSAPAFPEGAQHALGAVVRVSLKFTTTDRAPELRVLSNNGGEAFVQAVRAHVDGYRLPCLMAGAQAEATQEFQFFSGNKLLSGDPRPKRPPLPEACLEVARNAAPPAMPFHGEGGTVLAEMRFTAPDAPPAVTILFDGGDHRLAAVVLEATARYRLPCASAQEPVVATRQFVFRWEGDEGPRLRSALTLVHFLGLVRLDDRRGVRFDFTTMGCPFKVTVSPRQPYTANQVTQIGGVDDSRLEFITWLEKINLNIPPRYMKTLFGQPTTVDVPCTVLDLT